MASEHSMSYTGSELIRLVWRLIDEERFDPDEFVIAGSARLWHTGHRADLADIDIVARGKTWARALELAATDIGYTETTAISKATVVRLYGGRIEVSDHWFMEGSDTDELIDTAEIINGLRYFRLAEIIAYKLELDRPKDREDLSALCVPGHARVGAAGAGTIHRVLQPVAI